MRTLNSIVVLGFACLAPFARSQSASLLIGPGDLLHVQVFNTPELEQHPRVSTSGDVPLEFLGNVHVAGMTPADAGTDIEHLLVANNLVLRPQVTVTIDQYATQSVSILGEVHTPGSYQITAPRSVIDMLAMAGGLTPTADRNITIERQGSKSDTVSYFLSNDSQTAIQKSVLVNPGDTIVIAKAGIVYVLGDVGRPGGYTLDDNRSQLTALQLVAQAGGLNKTAIYNHIRLIRKNPDGTLAETRLRFSDMQKGKVADVDLEAGDILFVPFSYVKGVGLGASGIAAAVTSAEIDTHP